MKKQTKDYIQKVEQFLIEKYGNVQPQWEAVIKLLADNIELYNECQDSIKRHGIYNAESGKKNPLLATVKDLQATIMKQVQHLGLSPYAISKIKTEQEDDTDDYIRNLTNAE